MLLRSARLALGLRSGRPAAAATIGPRPGGAGDRLLRGAGTPARAARLHRHRSDLRLAVRTDLPHRVERLAAGLARILQLAHAVGAAQELPARPRSRSGDRGGSRAPPTALRPPASPGRARGRRRGTPAGERSCRRSCRRTGTAMRPSRTRSTSGRRSAGARPHRSSRRARARSPPGTGSTARRPG